MPVTPEERNLLSSGKMCAIDFLSTKHDSPLDDRSELIRFDLRENYSKHKRRVEDYLSVVPELASQEDHLIRIIVEEFTARLNAGESPTKQEYIERFPQFESIFEKLLVQEQLCARTSLPTQSTDAQVILASRYKLVGEPVGSGAFGSVYLGLDLKLNRPVAVKLPTIDSADFKPSSYLDEARMLAKFQHPNIVSIYDVGSTDEGQIYIVSQFVRGGTLKTELDQHRGDYKRIADTLAAVSEALQFAHDRKIIHRDIKPANILIDKSTKEPLLADFGLAITEEDLSVTSGAAGTPAYMSPEQIRGEGHRLDGRTDIFSLGVVLYELLTGELPFQGSQSEMLKKILQDDPAPPSSLDPSVPLELERICLKALSKQPSDRYAKASTMAQELRSWDAVKSIATEEDANKKITPKGLRSFDEKDAGYFLSLLPGPRNREGLPESIAFWKEKIEQRDPDKTFTVGLIYGPSGCGKSSLVKAGLIPHLSQELVVIYVEATAEDTEGRLLRQLRKRVPDLSEDQGFAETLSKLRRSKGRKVVLIIDQFEQWLYSHTISSEGEFERGLRQCDGARIQAVLMIRDDFYLAAARLMNQIDVPILTDENFRLVDLFDKEHAKKVLTRFGQAYDKLPSQSESISQQQTNFVQGVIEGLSEGDKVVSVRIALIADMLKNREWVPSTLDALGGLDGIGVEFLEETFASSRADVRHRTHQVAVRGILKALLPDLGTQIKGGMRSEEELKEASGYRQRPTDFNEVVRVLDRELRLITPTDPSGESRLEESKTQETGQRYYQLTHDYLVPSLRQWLTRKQRETKKGRAELKLAERAVTWGANPENKQLPTLWEWMQIRRWTDTKRWTPPERAVMRKAGRMHLRNWGSTLLGTVLGGGTIGYVFHQQQLRSQQEKITVALDSLQKTLGPAVPVNIEKLIEMKRPDMIRSDLASRFTAANEPREKLSLAFGLANFGQVEADYLVSQIDEIEDLDTANLINSLRKDRSGSNEKLRQAFSECSTPELQRRKARLALAALGISDTTLPIDACEFAGRPDPGLRTQFIEEFRRWELDRQALAETVKDSTSPALRSAVCLGLGQIPVKRISSDDKNRIAEIATHWYSLGDSSTHSAVAWLMREWEIPEPKLPDSKQMIDGRNWFVNSQGVTFVRITPPAAEFHSLPDPIDKHRTQFAELMQLTDVDLSKAPDRRFERAYAAYVIGEPNKALVDLERLIEGNFDLPKTLMYQTLTLGKLERTEEAEIALANWIANQTREENPAKWDFDSWTRLRNNTMLTSKGSKDGNRCVRLVATKQAPDDISFSQKTAVKRNTRYLLSGWIKTENVVVEQAGGTVGANFALASAKWDNLKSESVVGSSDWTYKTLVFNSANDDSITVAARLGFNNSTVSGTAWFDDLCLVELPDQTKVDDLIYNKPEYLTPELKTKNLLANSSFEDFVVVPTNADRYRVYVETLVALWSGNLEIADKHLKEALKKENALDRDRLFILACTTATFAKASMLSEVQRNYWLDQTIHLLQVWSSDSATDRSLIRTNPDFAGLREDLRFVNVAAERKMIPAQTYWLGNREVTRREYEAFLENTSYEDGKPQNTSEMRLDHLISPTLDQPAQKVSWYDALIYCNWLSRREGRTPVYRRAGTQKIKVEGKDTEIDKWEVVEGANGYRLPNGLEWEYACRAGSETDWNTGSDDSLLAAYCQMFPSKQAARSGEKLPNAWGMHDMHGNMWEWCWDHYGTEGSLRVSRGGSWYGDAANCQSAIRSRYFPSDRGSPLGFRLALSSESGIPKSPEADSK